MEQRPLGSTGITVSALGFGCGAVGGLFTRDAFDEQVAAAKRALDAGVTYFDTAAMYGNGASEQNLGRVLRELGAWDSVAVGTKVRLTAEELADPATAVRRSLTNSLSRLGRDRVDLLQLHNSLGTPQQDGPTLDDAKIEEINGAMRACVSEGLAGHVGFTGLGDPPALHRTIGSRRFETVQSYFNAINPSSGYAGTSGGAQDFGGLIDAAAEVGIGVIAIRVMAGGAIAGPSDHVRSLGDLVPGSSYATDAERAEALAALARKLSLESTAELGFRFVLAKPGVSTALIGFSDMDQLEQALRWTERGALDSDAVKSVLETAQ
jgi:aryl-alcohol dehydrogenase-like predicted oxidoreductase